MIYLLLHLLHLRGVVSGRTCGLIRVASALRQTLSWHVAGLVNLVATYLARIGLVHILVLRIANQRGLLIYVHIVHAHRSNRSHLVHLVQVRDPSKFSSNFQIDFKGVLEELVFGMVGRRHRVVL